LFPDWFSNADRNAFEPAEYNAGFKKLPENGNLRPPVRFYDLSPTTSSAFAPGINPRGFFDGYRLNKTYTTFG
jgi:hypothetical protein